jgi:L-alanine-DL-glutamate epimerase-like enolase superfamily enzyme
MLAWDKQRISAIHQAVKKIKTPYTESGNIAYYLDANGRYDSMNRLKDLLNYADEIGALERTVVVEEPFPEEYKVDVSGLPVVVAADESAHSADDVAERIALGYGAIALKPIAKTISVTLQMIETAFKHNVPCFCADLTVGPLLLDINKSFAARLGCLPGLRLPVVESNGWQNYTNWAAMESYSPVRDKAWTRLQRGVYELDASFYEMSGGMFLEYPHYRDLVLNG